MAASLEHEIRTLRSLFWSEKDPAGRGFAPLADAYRRAGDFDQALELLEDGLARLPDFASGHYVAGLVHAAMHEGEASIRSFERVLELDSANLLAKQRLEEVRRGDPVGLPDERVEASDTRPEPVESEEPAVQAGSEDDVLATLDIDASLSDFDPWDGESDFPAADARLPEDELPDLDAFAIEGFEGSEPDVESAGEGTALPDLDSDVADLDLAYASGETIEKSFDEEISDTFDLSDLEAPSEGDPDAVKEEDESTFDLPEIGAVIEDEDEELDGDFASFEIAGMEDLDEPDAEPLPTLDAAGTPDLDGNEDEASGTDLAGSADGMDAGELADVADITDLGVAAESDQSADVDDFADVADVAETGEFADTGDLADSGDGDLYTRTMGELYARQGLYARSVEVFEHLLECDPANRDFRDRLDELRDLAAGRGGEEEAVQTPQLLPQPKSAEVELLICLLLVLQPMETIDGILHLLEVHF